MVVLRRVLNALGLVALVVAPSACRVDLAVDVVVNEDGTGTVTLTATADADVVNQASGLAQDLRFDDLEDAGWVIDGPSVTDDDGITVTISHPFSSAEEATALLSSLNGEAGPFQDVAVTRAEDEEAATWTLSGAGRVDSGLAAFTDPDLLGAVGAIPYADEIAAANLSPTQAVGITFTIDLPGSVEESSADPEREELTWTVPLDGTSVQLSATSTLSYGADATWSTVATVFLVALIAWLVIAGAFIALVVRARRRRLMRPRPNIPLTTDVRVPRSPLDSDRL